MRIPLTPQDKVYSQEFAGEPGVAAGFPQPLQGCSGRAWLLG